MTDEGTYSIRSAAFNRYIRTSEKFLSFYKEIMDTHFILFYRITYDPFCSININITTFGRLGFTFV